MSLKQVLGLLVIIAGISCLVISKSIDSRLAEANQEIAGAKQKVSQGNSLFSMSPVTKEIGQGVTSSANKKISAGEEEVAHYQQVSMQLWYGGIALIVVGGCLVLFCRKKK